MGRAIHKFIQISEFSGRGKGLLVRKILMSIIILVAIVVVAMNDGSFNRNDVVERLQLHDDYQPVQISGNREVSQQFVARRGHIWKVGVRLYTMDKTVLH